MGDPETEVVLPRLNSDLVNIFNKMTEGKLNEINLEINPDTAATVILVSGGYPEDYQKGYEINGLNEKFNSLVFHSGTKWLNEKAVTNGGRVLAITSLGKTINEATSKSYETIRQINFDKMYFRKDIGKDLENFL
jgi:phosphoribosylamine--glycine ligase